MRRRHFLELATLSPALASAQHREQLPEYTVNSKYEAKGTGFPGAYPGKVVSTKSDLCVDAGGEVNRKVVAKMVNQGMASLTGKTSPAEAWGSMFQPADVVGIKVNCSGAPSISSQPELVGEIVRNLIAIDVPPQNIYIYERFPDQLDSVHYVRFVPQEVNIIAVEKSRESLQGYDPRMFVEVNFFGEQNTRSNVIALVSQKFTKIINVPVVKEHQAAGVTGCLKNIAYGNFSNVARSHQNEKTNTYTFIGTLASTEPLRSKTVLNIMDGLKGVWHGGPFSVNPAYRFQPKEILFGTDPVAMDRILIDIIEAKRKAEGAVSIWDRGKEHIDPRKKDKNLNVFIREPGHVEFASKLGLGVYDIEKIKKTDLQV
jgi:hypothetical protein